jgi:polysaccharide deacetylase family protein (PEP-CTERM system associated)
VFGPPGARCPALGSGGQRRAPQREARGNHAARRTSSVNRMPLPVQHPVLTIDVEDWFHILDSSAVPALERWAALEDRVEENTARLLHLLSAHGAHATFFWLGWVAERHKQLVRRCLGEGHEVASHGYAHLLPYHVGPARFQQDIVQAKSCLEDIVGVEVRGFRAAGFGITKATPWAFDVIRAAGYTFDASVFPGRHGHGGLPFAPLVPHTIETPHGDLFEIPSSAVEALHRRFSLFGGGYLRLASKRMIAWAVQRLEAAGRPLIVYLHPRDIDPEQPRLPLPLRRRFKCYVNLRGTLAKLEWLCETHHFGTISDLHDAYLTPSGACRDGPTDHGMRCPTGCDPASALDEARALTRSSPRHTLVK